MRKRITSLVLMAFALTTSSCLSTEEKKKKAEEEGNALIAIKSKLIKGAGEALKSDGKDAVETATEGVGEIIKGVNSGFDKSINQANIEADSVFLKTFSLGRLSKDFSSSDSVKARKVSVYLIAEKAFDGKVKLKAFDASGMEIGRSVLKVKIDEDDSRYFDFEFDKRTPLLQAHRFVINLK
ncbi:hypothetical protein FUAX_19360 [Fulvitalea axinellae]|uniref:Lipoprotein n=1 Tax=Fulvitalea axinellae TaxID=1182444 RepID=A0AAU9CSU0_9BACT|nr:hypothetical protein FUAX_19360 [Fulvitalea axinellae]